MGFVNGRFSDFLLVDVTYSACNLLAHFSHYQGVNEISFSEQHTVMCIIAKDYDGHYITCSLLGPGITSSNPTEIGGIIRT